MKKNRFFLLMLMVIVLCFVSSTVISTVSLYQVLQKHALKNGEIIAAGIYNDINSRLLEPVIVANTLASDHFLIELLENEEKMDAEEISREMDEYTTSYMKNFSYKTVFVASEKTKAYYTYDGFYKIMDVENDEDDVWYQKFVDSGKKYTVMLGGDEEYPDLWLIYIDVRIEDKEGNLLGVCGVSMELEEIQKQIAYLEEILVNDELCRKVIKDELIEVKEKYGDERRSEIVYSSEEFNPEDFYADDEMIITISHMGYIKRTPLSEFRAQNRGGVGSKGTETRDADFVEHIYPATMHNTMMFFTQKGKCYWLKVYEIPEGTKNSKGRAIQNLLNIDSDDAVNAYLRVKNLNDQEFINSHYVLFCTKNGVIKKTLLEQYSRPRQNGVNAITIREDDRVIEVRMTNGDNEIIIANRNGRAIRFHESAVRVMGRTATGVRGMTLDEDGQDEVVGMICIKDPEAETIMVVSEQGYGKRSDIEDYRKTNRGGKGVKTMNITDKTGKLVTIKSVTDENDLMIINKSGITIRLKVADVRIMGRATQGVRLINLEKRNDEIGSVCKVTSENEEELIEEGEENTLESPQNEVNNENEE